MAKDQQLFRKICAYVELVKPGIVIGNLITGAAGFFLAARGGVDYALLLTMLTGLSCIIGSACVINNFMDQKLDQKMERTARRPFVKKTVSGKEGAMFALILGALGSLILSFGISWVTCFIALIGLGIYTLIYTPLKPKSRFATEVGSIAGGVPPLVGYCAVRGGIDEMGWIFALMVVLWQMPHFFAIALYRKKEYQKAKIPVLPLVVSLNKTKLYILGYIIAFTFVSVVLNLGALYQITVLGLNGVWIAFALKGLFTSEQEAWAKTLFRWSLIVILGITGAIVMSS
ncbi:MAG: heme o synthase [Candidatus Rhabdochlamydia sp.]